MQSLKNQQKEQKELNLNQVPFNEQEKGTKFSERLKELIGERSGRAFAKEAGISYSTLHNYLTDTSLPTLDNLILLANFTNVPVEWLATGTDASSAQNGYNEPNYNGYEDIDDFRHISVSAGFGAFNDDDNSNEKVKIESSWLESRRLKAKDCAMFSVNGDSMYPTLKDGEEIIVDRAKRELQEGKIFVLNHMGTMWVKRVRVNYDSLELISDNSFYKPIIITPDEAEQLTVIGQVVRGYRDF